MPAGYAAATHMAWNKLYSFSWLCYGRHAAMLLFMVAMNFLSEFNSLIIRWG